MPGLSEARSSWLHNRKRSGLRERTTVGLAAPLQVPASTRPKSHSGPAFVPAGPIATRVAIGPYPAHGSTVVPAETSLDSAKGTAHSRPAEYALLAVRSCVVAARRKDGASRI
jgi:hypothetical protein